MELWIARDKCGSVLKLWYNKPLKYGEIWWSNDGYFVLDEDSFPEITFENSPQEVELKLIIKD